MFCSKCGKENIENAAFCSGCGSRLTEVQPAKKKRLSTAAGILDIVAGGFTILSLFCMLFFVGALKRFVEGSGEEFEIETDLAALVMQGAVVVCSILAIIGGILVLRRKNRVVAFTAAIGATLTLSPFGVAALVLTVMARDEFER